MVKRWVSVLDDAVEKIAVGDPQLMALKYDALSRIARSHGFRAPAVVSIDKLRGTITTERIAPLRRVASMYLAYQVGDVGPETVEPLFFEIGAILARIHGELTNPDCVGWSADATFQRRLTEFTNRDVDPSRDPSACLHGDFSFANIFVHQVGSADSELVVLDPCPNGGSTHHDWEVGPVYVDLGNFLSCLEGQVPLRHHHKLHPERSTRLQLTFLRGYESVSGLNLDLQLAFAYAYAVGSAQFDVRFGRWSFIPIKVLFNRQWKRNYPFSEKRKLLRALT